MKKTNTPLLLVILDGFGVAPSGKANAISQAKTPFLNSLILKYPHTLLKASGSAVGLPEGTVGNSEVGHMTIGTGKITPQALTLINQSITDGSFFTKPRLIQPLEKLARERKKLHIIGLLSDAGVHGTLDHIIAYTQAAHNAGITDIIIHPILDGRDVAPQSADFFLETLEKELQKIPGTHIGIIMGRFYAMDRDNNWDRSCTAYDALTNQSPDIRSRWQEVLKAWYATGATEEFLPPTALCASTISHGDGVILSNIRPERMRQLSALLCGTAPVKCSNNTIPLSMCIEAVPYDNQDCQNALFHVNQPHVTLKKILADAGYTIFTIAETEKYAHVTYFFDGGNERVYQTEKRVLIPSIKTRSYVNYPCMSAQEITQAVIHSLKTDPADFYLINYANADMVGHSGSLASTIKAVECLDVQIGELYRECVENQNGVLIITADHGNAEHMIDENGNPNTAHTTNQVPFILSCNNPSSISLDQLHQLSDIAPFILKLLQLPVPDAMKKA